MKVGTPTHWKRYFLRYLTKSGAPDTVPFKKKHFFYGRPKTKRDERNMFILGSGRIHSVGRSYIYLQVSVGYSKGPPFHLLNNCFYCILPPRNLEDCLCNFFLIHHFHISIIQKFCRSLQIFLGRL